MRALANIQSEKLYYLDLSYNKLVTDEGFQAFEEKKFPITHLIVSGMTGLTGLGLYYPIDACKETLEVFQGSLMDQDALKTGQFGKSLGQCWNVQSLDFSGSRALTDDFFNLLAGQYIEEEGEKIRPGFANLHTAKLNFLENVNDISVQKVCQCSPILEHLELTGCSKLSDYFVGQLVQNYPQLTFIDVNHIPAVTPAVIEAIKTVRPTLLQRRFKLADIDPKDNMLRVPLRVVSKAKKKGKKKKKKK